VSGADSASEVDVLIAGGGPAGATAACLLARAGHRVRVLEKERFPRFCIGESLLPAEMPIFRRLGLELGEEVALRKAGAQFLDEASGDQRTYLFAEGLEGTFPHAVQVERAGFDQALLALAREAGADVLEGQRVTEVEVLDHAVRVRATDGAHQARYFVDATGRQAFIARRQRAVEPITGFGRAAAFAHFTQVRPEVVESVAAEGNNVQVLIRPGGWTWVIPLPGRRLSIGVVSAEQGLTAEHLDEEVARVGWVAWWAGDAVRSDVHMVGNYSFRNQRRHGARYACVGDAACFLDPVFSSGVALAMVGAERLADLLAPALDARDEARADLMAPLAAHMDHAYATFSALIERFYRTRFAAHVLLHPDPDPELRAGLTTTLAGDLWRTDNRFQHMLLTSTRRSGRGSAPVNGD
jgi:flavin-dependent dehydrogenase